MFKQKKILFIVPDGVGLKNYLHSELPVELKDKSDIAIWSPLSRDSFNHLKDVHQIDFDFSPLNLAPEPVFYKFVKESIKYARLRRNSRLQNNETILTNWRPKKKGFLKNIFYFNVELLGHLISWKYKYIIFSETLLAKVTNKNDIIFFKKRLDICNFNSIFITHQRVSGLSPILLAAKELELKTITAIFSWDNLPKGSLFVKSDYYLLWSGYMKREMSIYYPEIDENKLRVVGTPQFEFFTDNARKMSRNEFAFKYGLDVNKKWICFSGDDYLTSPFDDSFLRDLAEELEESNLSVQIIFRRCPVDISNRYDSVLTDYPCLIKAVDPLWQYDYQRGWTGYYPNSQDINLLFNIIYHCEGVVNLGSTMALDFATRNKPCLYFNYNPRQSDCWNVETIYNFQHFRSMADMECVGWINNKSDILSHVDMMLNSPNLIARDRLDWFERLVFNKGLNSSYLIAKELLCNI